MPTESLHSFPLVIKRHKETDRHTSSHSDPLFKKVEDILLNPISPLALYKLSTYERAISFFK